MNELSYDMEYACFEPRLDADEAVDRTSRLTVTTMVRSVVRSLLGLGGDANPSVSVCYYPDYLAYTTVNLRRVTRSDVEKRFIAAVDGVTGRVGEVDVTLPDTRMKQLNEEQVVPAEITVEEAENAWDEWLFSYVNRTYRPIKRPETSLDSLELVYTPYYIVDYGEDGECYAVSALTKQVELIEDIPPVEETYYHNSG